jgi:hypothetical protein
MRRSWLLVVVSVFLASLAAGCRNSENSVTGTGSSNRVLSGQVLPIGDLAGASPAGITVTSSGQVGVTDAVGNFAFMGLPSKDVQLTFSRSDGINARTTVSADASAVLVRLQKSEASVIVTGQNKREIEGLILAISSSSITVDDASTHGPVTATISSSTVIRKGNRTLSASDLKVGDRVHVKAGVNADGSLAAFEIKLQQSGGDDNSDGGQTKELEGLILEVSASSITVNNASTHGPVTAAITGSTVIRKGNTRLTAANLKPGDRVHVKTTGSAGALVATEIMLQNPAP